VSIIQHNNVISQTKITKKITFFVRISDYSDFAEGILAS